MVEKKKPAVKKAAPKPAAKPAAKKPAAKPAAKKPAKKVGLIGRLFGKKA